MVHNADKAAPVARISKSTDSQQNGTSATPNAIGDFKSREGLEAEIFKALPAEGRGVDGFCEAISFLSRHSVNTSSHGFMDKLYSAPSPPGIAADLFLSMLNNNSHVWHVSPALSTVEKHVGAELARLFGLPGQNAGGITVPGGAAGNMLAMLVARNVVAPETKKHGCSSRHQKWAVFVSEAAHYSLANAAQIVGLGSDAVVRIATTPDGAMDVGSLELAVETATRNGTQPLLIAATAGTTVRGAFDPLEEIGRIAREADAWYHVDACWGGAVAFSAKERHRLAGAELADSISFNPHKLLGVPLVCSFLLARDLRTFWLANKLEAGYLFHDASAQAETLALGGAKTNGVVGKFGLNGCTDGKTSPYEDWRKSAALGNAPPASRILDLASLTTQCGRRPDASKLYLHWIYYGVSGMAHDVERALDGARYMAGLVDRSPHLTLVGSPDVPFTQVCFYWKSKAATTRQGDTKEERASVNSRATRALSRRLVVRGWMIDYAPGVDRYEQYGDFLRVACNRLTDRNVVDALLADLLQVGLELGL